MYIAKKLERSYCTVDKLVSLLKIVQIIQHFLTKHGYLLNFCLWFFHLIQPAKPFGCSFRQSSTEHIIVYIILNFSITKNRLIFLSLTQLQVEDHKLLHICRIFIFPRRIPRSYIKVMNCCK